MKNPISIYKSVISKLIYICTIRLVSEIKSNILYMYISWSVEKRVSISPFKENFHSIFRRITHSTPLLATALDQNVTQSSPRLGSHRRGKQGGDIGEHVGRQSCWRKEQVDWICVRWRKSVFENDLYSLSLSPIKRVRFQPSWKNNALLFVIIRWFVKIWDRFLEIKKKKKKIKIKRKRRFSKLIIHGIMCNHYVVEDEIIILGRETVEGRSN